MIWTSWNVFAIPSLVIAVIGSKNSPYLIFRTDNFDFPKFILWDLKELVAMINFIGHYRTSSQNPIHSIPYP